MCLTVVLNTRKGALNANFVCVRSWLRPDTLIPNTVAIFHLSAKIISRKAGRSATAAAAYRAGEKIIDERTGEIHDYTRKGGVEFSEIVMPSSSDWTPSRTELWNATELKNKRADAQVAREFVIALPDELSPSERTQLALRFARELADTYSVAADVAIHAPSQGGDDRNHHAHILTTTNRVDGRKLGNKVRELDLVAHTMGGKFGQANEIDRLRERWAEMANQALEQAGQGARIDHRSLEAQGIERVATSHLGPTVTAMERKGKPTKVAKKVKEQVAEIVAKAAADAAIIRAKERQIGLLEELLGELTIERENNEYERQQDFERIGGNLDAAQRTSDTARAEQQAAFDALAASGANLASAGATLEASRGHINGAIGELQAGRKHAADPQRGAGRAAQAAAKWRAARSLGEAIEALGEPLGRAFEFVSGIAQRCDAVVLKVIRAATRHYAQANGYDQEEPEVPPQDTATEAKKQALEAFLEKHKGLERVEDRKRMQYGTLVDSEGSFARLHMGMRRYVLHDFKTEQALRDFVQQQLPDRGPSLGR